MDESSSMDKAPARFVGAGGTETPFGFPLSFGGAEAPFPADDVEASAADARLQERERAELTDEQRRFLDEASTGALSQGVREGAKWIYFSSPDWTWEALCGRAGWLLYDPETKAQHAFQLTVMN